MTTYIRIQDELRETGQAEFEGVILRYVGEWEDLKPGDTYVAQRNVGPKLLTVREVTLEPGTRWVTPMEMDYCFNLAECVKVDIQEL